MWKVVESDTVGNSEREGNVRKNEARVEIPYYLPLPSIREGRLLGLEECRMWIVSMKQRASRIGC